MSQTIKVDALADAVNGIMTSYKAEVIEATKASVKEIAKETNNEIKAKATFGGKGEYLKAFAIKKVSEDATSVTYRWYVKAPYYRLTHLLEKGHVIKGGTARKSTIGRVKAYEHIKYGEEYAKNNLPKRIKEKLDK